MASFIWHLDFAQSLTIFDKLTWIGKGLKRFQDLGVPQRKFNVEYVKSKLGFDDSMCYQIMQVASLIKGLQLKGSAFRLLTEFECLM